MELNRDQLTEAMYAADLNADDSEEESNLRERYSGRAMYGAECFGLIVASGGEAARVLVELAAAGATDEALTLARVWREDSMGRSMIVYFPGCTVSD